MEHHTRRRSAVPTALSENRQSPTLQKVCELAQRALRGLVMRPRVAPKSLLMTGLCKRVLGTLTGLLGLWLAVIWALC